jgi:hypothetical protein
MSESENIKKTFEEAIGYPTVKIDQFNEDKLEKAIVIAYQLKDYLMAADVNVVESFTLNINDRDYHTTVFSYTHSDFGKCSAEVTIPVKFDQYHRIWTKNKENKFVWATFNDIKTCKADPLYIFYYLAGKFSLIPTEVYESDDLPF